jgi:enamine deaminase RidA (YjgF/YER057c/UK114 family)
MAVMDKSLKAAGAEPEHVVRVQVFMTDITERPKINPRCIAYFGVNLPASTQPGAHQLNLIPPRPA